MENLLVVAFEAHYPERNHHRRYEVSVGRDLFGDLTATVRYGRIGRGGQVRRYTAGTADALRALIRAHLLRRVSAPRRIGCAYRIVCIASSEEIDSSGWVPADVIGRLGGGDIMPGRSGPSHGAPLDGGTDGVRARNNERTLIRV